MLWIMYVMESSILDLNVLTCFVYIMILLSLEQIFCAINLFIKFCYAKHTRIFQLLPLGSPAQILWGLYVEFSITLIPQKIFLDFNSISIPLQKFHMDPLGDQSKGSKRTEPIFIVIALLKIFLDGNPLSYSFFRYKRPVL